VENGKIVKVWVGNTWRTGTINIPLPRHIAPSFLGFGFEFGKKLDWFSVFTGKGNF